MSGLSALPNTVPLLLDVTSVTSIASAYEEVLRHPGGRLDFLLNNAGQILCSPTLDEDIDNAMGMFDVNFWGVLKMIQAFSTLLILAKGAIVNLGSIQGVLYVPFTGAAVTTTIPLSFTDCSTGI